MLGTGDEAANETSKISTLQTQVGQGGVEGSRTPSGREAAQGLTSQDVTETQD